MRDCLGQDIQALAVRATVLLHNQITTLPRPREAATFAVKSMHAQADTYAAIITRAGHHTAERATGGVGDHTFCGDSRGGRMDRCRQPL